MQSNRPSAWLTPAPHPWIQVLTLSLFALSIGSCAIGYAGMSAILLAAGLIIGALNAIRGFIIVRNRKKRFWR